MTYVIAVIPARYQSSRFPGKPLAAIAGVPMIVRVLRNVAEARTVSRVLVATDDERIAAVVRSAGGEVAMTPNDIPSGTDRAWAAAAHLPTDIVVNVQGDEPLLPGAVVDALVESLEADEGIDIATPVVRCTRLQALSPDVVTVACDERSRAWYFSRSVVPWGTDMLLRHIGVYAYRKAALERFVGTAPTFLERTEGLEQLRALSLGLRITAVEVDACTLSVDRPEHVAAVERQLLGPVAEPLPADVRLVVLDVDGVLTDGSISYHGDAAQLLTFDVKDGYGIVALLRAGIEVALLSARDSPALRRRAQELGIRHLRLQVEDKAEELRLLTRELGVPLGDVCYMGDDEPDLQAMTMAGLSAAPADASALVKAQASINLTRFGGRGAVRELADLILGR